MGEKSNSPATGAAPTSGIVLEMTAIIIVDNCIFSQYYVFAEDDSSKAVREMLMDDPRVARMH